MEVTILGGSDCQKSRHWREVTLTSCHVFLGGSKIRQFWPIFWGVTWRVFGRGVHDWGDCHFWAKLCYSKGYLWHPWNGIFRLIFGILWVQHRGCWRDLNRHLQAPMSDAIRLNRLKSMVKQTLWEVDWKCATLVRCWKDSKGPVCFWPMTWGVTSFCVFCAMQLKTPGEIRTSRGCEKLHFQIAGKKTSSRISKFNVRKTPMPNRTD